MSSRGPTKGTAGAKICPECGSGLRRTDLPEFAVLARYVGVELVFWAAVVLVLAFLWAPDGDRDLYAVPAALAIAAWMLLRPRQRAARQAFAERARYHCEACQRRYVGSSLREDD